VGEKAGFWRRWFIRERITEVRRVVLKWESGSRMMMAALWPPRGIEHSEEGRMARAVMRYMREVLPAAERWWVGGGERSSRIGGLVTSDSLIFGP
jgi:hypothetical protein